MSKAIKGLCELVVGIVILIVIIRSINDKAADAKPAPAVSVTPHTLGDQFSVGYWAYRCDGARWLPFIGTGFSIERRTSAFLIFDITAQNNDTSSSALPPFHLVDSEGRIYDQASAGVFVDGIIGPLESLNPNVSKHGYLLFDVPPNRQYTLQVAGGYESRESALLALSLPVSANPPSTEQSPAPEPIQPTPHPTTPVVQPEPSAPPAQDPAPAPIEASKPTSGVLCNGTVEVRAKFRTSLEWRSMPTKQ